MKTLAAHLSFNGNCEEAFTFYKSALGGEFINKQIYADMPAIDKPVPDALKSKIMHIEYKFDDVVIMGADGMDERAPKIGNNVGLMLDMTDENEQETVFNKLSAGGTINMPLQDVFWGAKFGAFTDKFGVDWMLNCYKKK